MSNPVPLQVMIEVAKRDIRNAVIKARQATQMPLPPYILNMILSEIQAELAAEEKTQLINHFVVETTGEEKKTTDDHTDE